MAPQENRVLITGIGVVSPVGIGANEFTKSLKAGKSNFSSIEFEDGDQKHVYPIAKANDFLLDDLIGKLGIEKELISRLKKQRNLSKSSTYGIASALEAWTDSRLASSDFDPFHVAVISSGTNTQQFTLTAFHEKYKGKIHFINPNYGLNFFDSDIIGAVSEIINIRGEGYCVGSASASGGMSVINGFRLIKSGEYNVVVVIAPLMDLSLFEFQGFTSLGAMAAISPEVTEACCPFDKAHRGFVYGQNAGCIILESASHAMKRGKEGYASIESCGATLDGNRNPNPSLEGEKIAMHSAIQRANLSANKIGYVNTHGTSSPLGDKIESDCLVSLGLEKAAVNSTKSLIGHGLSAAGLVEVVACAVQLKNDFLHASNNLRDPINDQINWIRKFTSSHVEYALSNSFGFGGINTSLVLKNTNY